LGQQEFACQQDAKAVNAVGSQTTLFDGRDSQINKVPVYAGAGRPSQGAQPTREYYQVT